MKKTYLLLLIFLISLATTPTSSAYQSTSTTFEIHQTIQAVSGGSSANSFSTSTNFHSVGVGGGVGVGTSTSASFLNRGGYLAGVAGLLGSGGTSLTFTVDSNTKSLGVATPGIVVSATSALRVTTDNSSGYTLSANRDDSDTTIDLDTNASINIPDKTAWSPGVNCVSAGNATASTTEAQTLQFRVLKAGTDTSSYCASWWGTGDTLATALFAGFPVASQSVAYRSSAALSEVETIVLYNLVAPLAQVTGSYSGSITYTAVANP